MLSMSATREVSQRSGWLKAVAPCRGLQAELTAAGRAAGREAGGGGRARCVQASGRETAGLGFGRGEQRTANMARMVVTREVSQPEMSSLKPAGHCKL